VGDMAELMHHRASLRIETLEEALTKIEQWAAAYPIGVFPEPDWPKVAETLLAAGLSLDQVSASCMRHVARGMGQVASKALSAGAPNNE
jgi:hypothetical protein